MASNEPAQAYVNGPDIASIGYIPYFMHISRMPANAYTTHRYRYPAFSMLFDSGNKPAPPERFSGKKDFVDFLRSKEYRAALALTDVRLYFEEAGTRRRATHLVYSDYTRRVAVGYTPMKVVGPALGGLLPVTAKWALWYSEGHGLTDAPYDEAIDRVTINQYVKFRIGKVGNLGNYVMTGHGAPFAIMKITYTLFVDGRAIIDFAGTDIPTQNYYIDWRRRGSHNMLGNSAAQIDAFITAGNAADAPVYFRYRYERPPMV